MYELNLKFEKGTVEMVAKGKYTMMGVDFEGESKSTIHTNDFLCALLDYFEGLLECQDKPSVDAVAKCAKSIGFVIVPKLLDRIKKLVGEKKGDKK